MSAVAGFQQAANWVSVHLRTENKEGLLMLDFWPIITARPSA